MKFFLIDIFAISVAGIFPATIIALSRYKKWTPIFLLPTIVSQIFIFWIATSFWGIDDGNGEGFNAQKVLCLTYLCMCLLFVFLGMFDYKGKRRKFILYSLVADAVPTCVIVIVILIIKAA